MFPRNLQLPNEMDSYEKKNQIVSSQRLGYLMARHPVQD